MSRPLGFPRGGGRILKLLLGALLLPILFVVGVGGWLAWSLTPLQNFYLNAYTASSFSKSQPRATTQIRWVMKTAPGRKPLPMIPTEATKGGTPKLPVALSAQARAAGWRGVALSAPERVNSAQLAPLLESGIYDDVSLARLIFLPAIVGLSGLMVLIFLPRKVGPAWGSESSKRWEDRAYEARHGRRTRGPQLSLPVRQWLGKDAGIRLKLAGEGVLGKVLPTGGSYQVPRKLESSHILLMGDTGSGKSSAIRQILRQVQKRGESAIVYDPAMDFVSEFYDPERGDLILNPLDERCPYWNVADEVFRPEMATTIAAAFLTEKEYEKAFFTDAPRRVLAHLLAKEPQVRDLLRWMSDPEEIALRVKGTPLATLVDPAAPAQRAGVLSSLNLVADSLELLPEWSHTRKTFSTAEWHYSRKRWVFLTSNPGFREKILPLHSVWLDLFILRMMGYCEDREAKPVWFVLDELASLNKLPQLHTAVTENRKYGNPVVLGFQGRSQLEKRYGQDAEAMLSQPATKIFFKTSEPRAAKWVSEAIGEIEVERLKESRTPALLGSKKSYAMEIATKPLVMASEIAGLAPLRAFIKQENRVAPVRFRLARKRGKQPEFVERKLPELTPRLAPEPAAPQPILVAPVLPPQPATKALDTLPFPDREMPKKPMQSALPPVPKAAEKSRAAFVWDESKGID